MLSRDHFKNHFNVSRETIERLDEYERLLIKWNSKINLVSKTTIPDIWHRHFADSAQLWPLIPENARSWLDFGSGAGFPALVNAVIAKEKQPGLNFNLVESDHRKCAFLNSVVRELDLLVKVETVRVEESAPQSADIISARAVASLSQLLGYSARHRHANTILLFPKGMNYESELTAAQKHWHIDVRTIKSLTDSNSVILRIEGFERVD